ncbi:hypothetical protein KOR42_23120 [Thalassoglobus neptunius]|uniref:Uncharacterized protein n=1 Tax=Thalassoglobus neptunius TaxID=1938619 RepID=A0A5C5X9S6_9PLAN|nr:hypothetical protein KOR42_23120 [Thalassoglobus neptunius]
MTILYRCEEHGEFRENICPECQSDIPVSRHRTLWNVILNPILRFVFGVHIVSVFDDDWKLIGYRIQRVQ